MLLSAVSVLVVAQSSSEVPEGLMNNPVLKSLNSKLDSLVGTVSMLQARRPQNWGFNCRRCNDFTLFHSVVTGSAVYPASNSMATRELSLMVKGPGRETGHSPPPSAQN